MIRATFIAAAVGVCAASSGAQNPAPTPPPVPPQPSVEQPVTPPLPAPMARPLPPLPSEWPSVDFSDLDQRLDALRDMKMDLRMPPMLPMPPMPDLDFDFDRSMQDLDRSMQDMGRAMDEAMSDLDFDVEMPPMPPMPPMTPIPPMTPMAMEPIEPMIMAPMGLMALEPWTPTPRPGAPVIRATPVAAAALRRASAALERIQGQSPFERQFGGITSDPPKAWAQSDPADSLYRLARETLNRGEYRRAAQLFGDISQRFPNSVYASDARYWRAFALYRIGGANDLREALSALQDSGRGYRQVSLQTDAAVLATRIRGALAALGDPVAARDVSRAASDSGTPCDREDLAVRVEALNSLGQTDPESTTPILRRLLARRDDCSASLRRAALYLLGRRTDADAMNLVMTAARNDPDTRVRADALRFLAAMPGDQAVSTIEEMARTPGNEELQRAAIAALGRSDNPRARQSLRAIIERTDLSESLRIAALSRVDAEHTTDNGAYIRSIYPRLETPPLKAAAIRAVARVSGNDNDQWLLSVVRNQSEPVEVRAMALRFAGRSTIPIADLVRMYDVTSDRPLREQLISLYAQRPDPEATDKLLAIARTGTDPDMRRYAISALSRKNDPRTKKLLLEIIDK